MRIGIIGATEREIMPFIMKLKNKQLRKHAMLNFHIGTYEGCDVVAVCSGVCKVNAAIAAQVMLDRFEISHAIMAGVAGALDERVKIGDIVISSEIAYHDVEEEILTKYHPRMESIYFKADSNMIKDTMEIAKSLGIENKCHIGKIITGESFITGSERQELIEHFAPMCVDMESAAFAHVCYANNVPFLVIRSVSDFANENASETFEKNKVESSLNALYLVENLIKKYA